MEPKFPAHLLHLRIEIYQLESRFAADHPWPEPPDGIHGGHLKNHTALKWHRLAVIAGSSSTHGQRHFPLHAPLSDLHDIGFTPWHYKDVAVLAAQGPPEHRAKPVKVPGFLLHPRWIETEGNTLQPAFRRFG